MKHRPSRRWLFALAAVTAISLIATVAYAAIPDAAGIIHACRANKTGVLRVIDTEAGQRCLGA
jgi:hypothetical protein